MKRIVVVACLVAAVGCASLSARLGKEPTPAGPDQSVVNFKVCHGDNEDQVREYIVDQRGGASGLATEMIVRGRQYAESHSECVCYVKCIAPVSPAAH